MSIRPAFRSSLISSFCAALIALQAFADEPKPVDVPPGDLIVALKTFARQTGVEVVYRTDRLQGMTTHGVTGTLTAVEAARRLLEGTQFSVSMDESTGAMLIATGPSTTDVSGLARGGSSTAGEIRLAQAQPAEGTGDDLEEVTVTGTTVDDPILSSRTGDTLRERPQSVSIVTRERMDEQNLHSLGEAVQQATGVTTTSFSAISTYFYSRGFQVNNVQIDGSAPLVLNNFGYLTSADMEIFEQVEVTRGADALFSGNGDPGGTIQLVRKRPTSTPQIAFSASAARWGSYRGSLDASGPLGFDGRLRGRVIYAVDDGQAFYDNSERHANLIYGVLEAEPVEGTLLTFGGVYDDTRSEFAGYGLPRYSDGGDLELPRSIALTPDWARNDNVDSDLYARIEQRISDSWNVRVNATRSKHNSNHNVMYPWGGFDPDTGEGTPLFGFRNPHFRGTENLVDATLRGQFELFGRPQKLFLGVDRQDIESTGTEYGIPTISSIDVFHFDPASIEEPARSAIPDDSFTWGQKQTGVFVSANLNLVSTLHLLGGARYSNYEFLFDQVGYDTATGDVAWTYRESSRDRDVLTPFVGVTYDLRSGWTVYGSFAESYKSQALSLQGPPPGTPLDPITGESVEFGLKGNLWRGRAATQLAVYRIERNNEAIRDASYPDQGGPNGSVCCYIGRGVVESRGFDAEVNGNLLENWKLFVGYTYNENEYKSGFTDNLTSTFMPQTPKHLLKLWTTFALGGESGRWKLGAGLNAQSATYVSGTAVTRDPDTGVITGTTPYRFTQEGYAVASARAEYRINSSWSASVNVNNIFDKVYYETVGDTTHGNFYGQPRSWVLSLRSRW